jgi:hypothetical protein
VAIRDPRAGTPAFHACVRRGLIEESRAEVRRILNSAAAVDGPNVRLRQDRLLGDAYRQLRHLDYLVNEF